MDNKFTNYALRDKRKEEGIEKKTGNQYISLTIALEELSLLMYKDNDFLVSDYYKIQLPQK